MALSGLLVLVSLSVWSVSCHFVCVGTVAQGEHSAKGCAIVMPRRDAAGSSSEQVVSYLVIRPQNVHGAFQI